MLTPPDFRRSPVSRRREPLRWNSFCTPHCQPQTMATLEKHESLPTTLRTMQAIFLQSCAYLPTTNCKGSPWVIIASSPAFCSPLKGVAAGFALGQTFASSSGESNQKPTLKVWIGLN